MTPERWEQIERLYHSALEREPGERESFLDLACAGDDELRREISSLLAHDGSGDSFIAAPALADAARLMAGDPLMESTATRHDAPAVVKEIGPYKLQTLLGKGGMGEVHLAFDTRLNRKVAVKLLPTEFTQDAERVRRFKQEARAASALNHPNVIAIYDIGETAGAHYLVMERIEGETLRRRMAATPQQGMKSAEALEVAAQVAAALSAAHEAGVIHRDIKPENVMVRKDGLVKVLDFGLARLTLSADAPVDSQAPTAAKLDTVSGVVMGTASYMSPEQARGQKVDARTDIFSLGVILYEMLAGRRPFEGATMSDVIAAVLTQEPVPLSRYNKEVAPGLEQVVLKCLAKERGQRFQTADEFAAALKTATQRGATTGDAWRSFFRSRLVWLVSALAVLLIAAVVYWKMQPKAAPEPSIRSLAVLPLKSLGKDTSDDYLGLGIANAIITKTSQIGELTVRPTSAVRKYISQDVDALEAARQLMVDSVLDGTIQREGDHLRVSVNLLRVQDGSTLWADSFDTGVTNVFAIQDEVARQVVAQLRFRLSEALQARIVKRDTSNPEAYQYFLKGMYSFDKRSTNPSSRPDVETAIAMFKKAVEADPNYVQARAKLAQCYWWLSTSGQAGPEWFEQSKQELSRVEALGPDVAEAHAVRADLLWSHYMGLQVEPAIRELLLAQRINPSVGNTELASRYNHLGLESQALRVIRRALEIDPTSQINQDRLIETYVLTGKYDDAIAASARDHRQGVSQNRVALAFIGNKRFDDARREIELALKQNPNDAYAQSEQALLLAAEGKFREAEDAMPVIEEKTRILQAFHHIAYNFACVYALEGKTDEAVKWLRTTVETGMPNYPLFARDPHLESIRQNPAFIQLMAELKTRWENARREFE